MWGGLGCDSQQQTTPVRQASEPTPEYALKTGSIVLGYRRLQPGTFLLKPSQSCSLSARQQPKKKRANRRNTSLILTEKRTRLNITSLFCYRLPNNGPRHSLKSTTHRQFDWKCEDGLCLLEIERREERGVRLGGRKGDNHQVHSQPICCPINGLILLECKAAATLTLSQQWRENAATGSP